MSINCILTGNKITEHDLADELMLPVQNGGLYINSETTQEDKAEAVEAIKGIGLSAEDVVAPYGFNATDMTLDELLNYTNNWNYPFVCGIQYDSAIAPEVDTCVCIGVKSMLYAFSFIGKIYYCNNAETGWIEVTDDFLPLDGSVPMSGMLDTTSVALNGKQGHVFSNINTISVKGKKSATDEINYRELQLLTQTYEPNNANMFRITESVDGIPKSYKIFGEHNKPSGSYTGNGSATTREINIGGIGGELLITTNYGDTAKVTKNGAIINKAGTLSAVASGKAKFVDGKLTLATTETALNENTRVYTYEVK